MRNKETILTMIIVSLSILLVCLSAFAFTLYFLFLYHDNNPNKVYFEGNFTTEEKQFVMDIIEDIKPEYLGPSKKITIYKKEFDDEAWGINDVGYIKVLYWNDSYLMRTIICHELIHSIVNSWNEEEFVYEISETEVCYKTRDRLNINLE